LRLFYGFPAFFGDNCFYPNALLPNGYDYVIYKNGGMFRFVTGRSASWQLENNMKIGTIRRSGLLRLQNAMFQKLAPFFSVIGR
jgi:hypothetical protein